MQGEPGPGAEYIDLGYAQPDLGREARMGLPEVVYGPGKKPAEIAGVVRALLTANTGPVLVTRVDPEIATTVDTEVPGGTYDSEARLITWRPMPLVDFRLLVCSAGTADGPVATEAASVATALGMTVHRVNDVGVAGLHRLLAKTGELAAADAIICVAGMEGALASVVGGLVGCPVIAVPTSVGYGASLDGVTALLAMLSSCAAGLVVVNIDSGFGAALAAHRMIVSRDRR